jgi:HEAT repeats
VSALPGGSADKLGNQYESWWTLLRIGDLLTGKAVRIRLEPPGPEGAGVEFWIDEQGKRWFEQAKDAPAEGSWTVRRLIREGVLASVRGHLANSHEVRLVVSTSATALAGLSSRAAKSVSLDEFRSVLNSDESDELPNIAAAWGTDGETTWRYLQHVHVEHLPHEALGRLVHLTYERLVQGDPGAAIDALGGWLTKHLQEVLTAPEIWVYLSVAGSPRRLLAGDPDTLAALTATVERQRRRADAARPAVGFVEQPQVAQVVQQLLAGEHQVVIVHGRAGSGKSALASEVVSELVGQGWYAGALRMDSVSAAARSARAVGRDNDLAESPVVLLDGVAEGSPTVLLVDQLDAVSTYAGRIPESFDAVTELLEQARLVPSLKVLLVVRTVDLEQDPRLRHLLADTSRVASLAIGDLGADAVRHALQAGGIDVAALTETTVHLLRVPLHFAVFSRLSPEAQRIPYRTLAELYERYSSELRMQVERQVGHLDWDGIITVLVDYMNQNETLLAPEAVLDRFPRLEVNSLLSASVLLREGTRIRFFHETYFDYLFARAFVLGGHDLHQFLAESGQYLFHRAQARQVLEYLAATDREAFRRIVVRLVTSNQIRPHLRDVVAGVLRQLDASPDDVRYLESVMFAGGSIEARLLPLVSSPAWFDAADQAGRLNDWLDDPAKFDKAGYQLIRAARHRPVRVAELVAPHVGTTDGWRHLQRALIQWSLIPELVDLAVALLDRGDLDGLRGPIAVNAGFFSVLYSLHRHDPAGTARVIGAYLRRHQARAEADGSMDPFASGHLPENEVSAAEIISAVAGRAPQAFADEVLTFLVRVIEANAQPGEPGSLRATARWGIRFAGQPFRIDSALFAAVEQALRSIARVTPAEALALARPLAGSDIEELRFLACRTFAAADIWDEALKWLLEDDRNLRLGWFDSPWTASRELIAVCSTHCGDVQLEALSKRLLDFYPPRELLIQNRHLRGRAQYELLSAIEPFRRNPEVARRVGELGRKFADSPPTGPQPIEASEVGPPISEAASYQMSDDDWLRAIARHSSDEITWNGDVAVGGASELAQVLAQRAAEDPRRYARLALRFDAGTQTDYFLRLIETVAGRIPLADLSQLCQHAHDIAGSPVGRSICFAISRAGGEVDDTLAALLIDFAADPDPDRELARTPAAAGEFYFNGNLLFAGLKSIRGSAAQAIADVLFRSPERADQFSESLTALASDPILAVRTRAAEALRALMNHRPGLALDLAEALLTGADIALLGAHTVTGLLVSGLVRRPEKFASHLQRALDGPDLIAEQAGQAWSVGYLRRELPAPLPDRVTDLNAAGRRGAAQVLARHPVEELPTLRELFADEDPGVRATAATALRALPHLPPQDADPLLRAFVDSPANTEHFEIAVSALADSTQVLPDATIMACRYAATLAGNALGDITTRHPMTADYLISILLRLYRQGDATIRSRCLDVIDQLSESRAFDLDQRLDQER